MVNEKIESAVAYAKFDEAIHETGKFIIFWLITRMELLLCSLQRGVHQSRPVLRRWFP